MKRLLGRLVSYNFNGKMTIIPQVDFKCQVQEATNCDFAMDWLPNFATNPPTEKETKD